MQATLPYDKMVVAGGILDVDEVGSCNVRGVGEQGEEYYLIVETSLGYTYLFEYGPNIPDMQLLPDKVRCSLTKMEYKEDKLVKVIDRWLNDPSKKLKSAELIDDKYELLDACKDLISSMKAGF